MERAQLAERDRRLAGQKWGVSLGTVDLADVPIDQVRERIVVSDTADQVFAGTLQSVIDLHGRLSLAEADGALSRCGRGCVRRSTRRLAGPDRRARPRAIWGPASAGGGQALGLDPQVLILVDPTSAVDAHTEALIAERLVAHRREENHDRDHRVATPAASCGPGGVSVQQADHGVRDARGTAADQPGLSPYGGAHLMNLRRHPMTELQSVLRGSAETWRSTAPTPQVPEALLPPTSGSLAARLRAWRQRHLLRERRAEEFFADSRKPDLGLPVADRRDVGAFASRLLKSRRLMITALLVLHALAAMAGLVVPRILGSLVDAASAGGTLAATLNGLALAVTGVVVLQAILTFFALRMSVLFGQDPLAEAREYVVRTVLGLPLGRVESASTGDLVTRVTRDVSTMSMSVRFGLPVSVIASMTTLLTVVAMLLNSPLLTLPLLVTAPLLIFAARRT